MDTVLSLAVHNFREMVPFFIDRFGFLKHILGTELDTKIAALAAIRDYVNLAFGNLCFVKVYGSTRKHFHYPLLSTPRAPGYR